MDVENPLINSPVEIEKNMLITVVGKGSIQNRFLVLSKTDTNILLGYYEYDLVKHPEMLASHSACMERLSFMNNHKGLRHTTPKQKGECRDRGR